MPGTTGTETSTQVEAPVDDRRAAIEAAFEQHETSTEQPEQVVKVQEQTPEEQVEQPVEKKEAKVEEQEPQEQQQQEQQFNVDKAPQAWRAGPKAFWDKLDPAVRQEVVRREREITRVLGETAGVRQFANQFQQAVSPFMGRLQAMNTHPLTAVQELLKADYLLSTAPKAQRAAFMAKLIKDYDVDIQELDGALSGKGPADPVDARVEQLLQQRLAPIQQFLTQQQQNEQQRSQQITQEVTHTVETMATDPKYPHFEAVRETMADIVEIMANRGQHISIETAYNRAVAMDPTISKQVNEAHQAAQQNQRAQRALKASTSVGGAPSGLINGAPSANDRRATIAAAFDAVEGR